MNPKLKFELQDRNYWFIFNYKEHWRLNILWYSKRKSHIFQTDGTFDTMSTLSFTATRFENGGSLTCEATNDVMQSRNEAPMRDNIKLEVMCKYCFRNYLMNTFSPQP